MNFTNNNNDGSFEVQNILNQTDCLIREAHLFCEKVVSENQQTPTQESQPPLNDTENLTRSNHALRREINRLNHNIEIERLRELARIASPYNNY